MVVRSNMFDLEICCAISARLEQRAISRPSLLRAYRAASCNGTSFCSELIQNGVDEDQVYAAVADLLGLEFTADITPSRLFVSQEDELAAALEAGQVLAVGENGMTCLYVAPDEARIRMLRAQLQAAPRLAERIRICTPGLLRRIVRQRQQKNLADRARAMTPEGFSASRVLDTPQAFAIISLPPGW